MHDACVFCLGCAHVEAALDRPDCSFCKEMRVRTQDPPCQDLHCPEQCTVVEPQKERPRQPCAIVYPSDDRTLTQLQRAHRSGSPCVLFWEFWSSPRPGLYWRHRWGDLNDEGHWIVSPPLCRRDAPNRLSSRRPLRATCARLQVGRSWCHCSPQNCAYYSSNCWKSSHCSLCHPYHGCASSLPSEDAADLVLRVTKKTAQGIGHSMGSLMVFQRHLWLTLMDMRDSEKAQLLDVPISPHGFFGDAVGSLEKFLVAQKQSKVLSHFLPKWAAAPPARSRSFSAQHSFEHQIDHQLHLTRAPETQPCSWSEWSEEETVDDDSPRFTLLYYTHLFPCRLQVTEGKVWMFWCQ